MNDDIQRKKATVLSGGIDLTQPDTVDLTADPEEEYLEWYRQLQASSTQAPLLPSDVWQLVLSFLKPTDLGRFSSVSRSFYCLTRSPNLIYRDIVLDTRRMRPFESRSATVFRGHEAQSLIWFARSGRDSIRSIRCYEHTSSEEPCTFITRESLDSVLRHCTNLTSLVFPDLPIPQWLSEFSGLNELEITHFRGVDVSEVIAPLKIVGDKRTSLPFEEMKEKNPIRSMTLMGSSLRYVDISDVMCYADTLRSFAYHNRGYDLVPLFKECKQLEEITVNGYYSDWFENLPKMEHLRVLRVSSIKIYEKDFLHLKGCHNLEELEMSFTSGDLTLETVVDCATSWKKMRTFEYFIFGQRKTKIEVYMNLMAQLMVNLPSITRFGYNDGDLTDQVLSVWSSVNPNLIMLDVLYNFMTVDCLPLLSAFTTLSYLRIGLDAEMLTDLHKYCPNLVKLKIGGGSPPDLQKLIDTLPRLRVLELDDLSEKLDALETLNPGIDIVYASASLFDDESDGDYSE
ncbi:hypothetical protein PROFUN_13341 [Planoprotostelium fungivorum]|uniref:F-box domain-containing protein n=1 Tax=Planoprotostelium fungivorum TaxID=1890364 RepID=A0A2P6N4N0_9EUKA|nr:hypothetical protein PROFUN_13341 [Planoprotostelium fungivorum]